VITLVRYQANGTLDGNFGHRGMVTTPIGSGNARALALVAQPDGKLVAAGYSAKGPSLFGSFALVRYNPNGTLDPSFGKGAIVRTAIGSGDARAAALVLQPDGKLVAAGTNGRGFALARYGK
jgi:uncharacterized delta-60 repeat protein